MLLSPSVQPTTPGGLAGELEAGLDVQSLHELVEPPLEGPVADTELLGACFVG
jgi:hypothetical protein